MPHATGLKHLAFQIEKPGARRATELLVRAWSHGSASRRSSPRHDSPSPSGKRTSPRSRDGPLASAVTPFAPHLEERASARCGANGVTAEARGPSRDLGLVRFPEGDGLSRWGKLRREALPCDQALHE